MVTSTMTTLNPRAKAKWLGALRSGRFRQGKGAERLATPGPLYLYDAIGVLGEVYQETEGGIAFEPFSANTEVVREDVRTWAGLTPSQVREVALRNDQGQTFEDIALYVEGL